MYLYPKRTVFACSIYPCCDSSLLWYTFPGAKTRTPTGGGRNLFHDNNLFRIRQMQQLRLLPRVLYDLKGHRCQATRVGFPTQASAAQCAMCESCPPCHNSRSTEIAFAFKPKCPENETLIWSYFKTLLVTPTAASVGCLAAIKDNAL